MRTRQRRTSGYEFADRQDPRTATLNTDEFGADSTTAARPVATLQVTDSTRTKTLYVNPEEAGDLAVELAERVGVLAGHLQVEGRCE